MFCGKCGKEIKEGTKFCPMCGGTVANVSQNKEKSTNKKRKAASIVGICAIALVVIVLFTTIGSGSGYKGIVKKYFRSMEKADGALYASIIADAYKQDMIDGWGYEEDELVEGYGEELQDEMSDYALQYGNNIKISYEIDDVYSATENDLIELRRELEYYGFGDTDISKALVADCYYTVKGSDGEGEYHVDLLIMKVDGKWCMTRGLINVSWY